MPPFLAHFSAVCGRHAGAEPAVKDSPAAPDLKTAYAAFPPCEKRQRSEDDNIEQMFK